MLLLSSCLVVVTITADPDPHDACAGALRDRTVAVVFVALQTLCTLSLANTSVTQQHHPGQQQQQQYVDTAGRRMCARCVLLSDS